MKKFLAGVIVTMIIICIIFIVITQKTNNNPITKTLDQITKSDPIEVKPDSVALVKEIQKLAKLETASLSLSQVFNATRDNKRLWGLLGEELVFVANGEVIAGINFESMTENDFKILNNNIIEINLPKAEIFSVIIDNKLSYVASRTKGLFATADSKLETEVRCYAQDNFKELALKSDLLEKAYKNATNTIQDLAKTLGFTDAVFTLNG